MSNNKKHLKKRIQKERSKEKRKVRKYKYKTVCLYFNTYISYE